MKLNNKKCLLAITVVVGLIAMTIAPISQAGWRWHHWHRWHWQGRVVKHRGCRRIVINRYCRFNRFGARQCYRARRVRWVC